MRMIKGTALFSMLVAAAAACGSDGDAPGDLFPPKPECEGASVTALAGMQPQVINKLEIGTAADGFDLDNDGEPDNKLAAVASIAKGSIDDSLKNYSIIIPFEFFDLDAAADDSCVKFAIYLGKYVPDVDTDGDEPLVEDGDCNDNDMAIHPGVTEVDANGVDDDCDGLADEDAQDAPNTTNVADADGDGQTVADGDCDDRVGMGATIKLGAAEICGDGFDNDCDGVADRTERVGMEAACSPFDPATLADIPLDPLSFVGNEPAISFKDGVISTQGGKLVMDAGPSIFSVNIPVTDGINLDLRISGATIQADVVEENGAIVLKNGRLGGVIDAKTADTIRGLEVEQIGLLPENSLLDATFANLLGPLLALPKSSKAIQTKY
ncbi:MAG: putative metal-binding motif-containing protein, partial [Deltaproteobacteria bacterium]|nr:putative metal-binding motif-containing protein [Deltaproteobacteria bacterium]